ncbi:MAG: class I SAM-dependent methyltransferase [Deltaproteobacteria bacterium]|nr:class I SAM-dependent methyltransferase [Candidatus Anaeroferrophillus wilburensis]MBN2889053.1 class I SAM-dependent methyltransferase [Deltaproteobacteria bacterium]
MGKIVQDFEFSKKYDEGHSRQYYEKHQEAFGRRMSDRREQQMARQALAIAGNPQSILDIPCGAGRFWPLLAEDPLRRLYGADASEAMLAVAVAKQPQPVSRRFTVLQSSALAIKLPEKTVESIFCMRLLHHIGQVEDRLAIYREFSRVASRTIILSLWVDGNLKSWRRKKMERSRQGRAYQNRFVLPRQQVENEFRQVGINIIGKIDFLKFYSMWRVYVLGVSPQ